MAFRLMEASSSLCPPDRKVMPLHGKHNSFISTFDTTQDRFYKHDCVCRVCMTACNHLTRDCRRHSAAQGSNSGHCDLLVAVFVGAGVSSSDHVGLEQGTLQVDMVVRQGLVDRSQDLLGNVLAALQIVVTIRKNLRLDNGDNAVLPKTR